MLLLAIKKSVDEDRRPGRFLLTGSANLMALPQIADSLAGRMEILTLLPLAQCELYSSSLSAPQWLDALFMGLGLKSATLAPGKSLVERVLQGGYPESIMRSDPRRRRVWARQYIRSILQRDVKDVAHIEKLDQLPHLLSVLAQTSGQLCNYSQLGGQVGLDHKTTSKYLAIFEHLFLLKRVHVWSNNSLTSLVKAPKLQFVDAGLLSVLLNFSDPIRQRKLLGQLLESFVFSELSKLITWATGEYQLFYYRDTEQVEVDFILENADGDIIGIEVKAAAHVALGDLAGLKKLAHRVTTRFKMGIVLYDGMEQLPLASVNTATANGATLWAVPFSVFDFLCP